MCASITPQWLQLSAPLVMHRPDAGNVVARQVKGSGLIS